MKKLSLLLQIILFSTQIFAQSTITSVQDGNWSDPATWGGEVPKDWLAGQIVIIKHHVTLDQDLSRGNNTILIDTNASLKGEHSISIWGDTGKIINYGVLYLTKLTGTGILKNYDTVKISVECNNFYGQHKLYNYKNAYFYDAGIYTDNGNLLQNYGTMVIDSDFTINSTMYNYGTINISGTVLMNSSSDVHNYGKITSKKTFQTNAPIDNEALIVTYGEFYQNSDLLNNGAIYVFGSNNYFLQYNKTLSSSSCGYINVGCNLFVNNGSVTGKININGKPDGSGTFGPDVTFYPYNLCANNPVTYVSRRSGYWDDVGICPDSGGTWSTLTLFPKPVHEYPYLNGKVIISSGTTVTVRTSDKKTYSCDSLVIKPQAALTINKNDTLIINSNLIIKSPLNSGATGSLIDYGKLIVKGSSTVERFITGYRWHYIGFPVKGVSLNSFFLPNFYYYDETTNDSWDGDEIYGTPGWTHPTQALLDSPMIGFIYYYKSTLLKFTGQLYTDTVSITLSYTNNHPDHPEFDGWNLVANPYPSAIDWDSVNTDNIADNCIYYYDDDDGQPPYYNNYRYYIKGGSGTSPSPSIALNQGSRYIPVAQAFFVKTSVNKAKLVFYNSVRTHNFTDFYKKSAPTPNFTIKLALSGASAKDETAIRFLQKATAEYDGKFDAVKMFASKLPQIYSVTPNKQNLAINSMPFFKDSIIVNLGVSIPSPGEYSITAYELNFPDSMQIFLIDTHTDSVKLLSPNVKYSFSAQQGNDTSRFKLKFIILHTNKPQNSKTYKVHVWTTHNRIIINQISSPKKLYIRLFSIDGRLLKKIISSDQTTIISPVNQGLYILNISSDNLTLTRKLAVF